MSSNEDDYTFLHIRDAISSINQKVNLIGMVVEFGTPQKSKGTGSVLYQSIFFRFLCTSILLGYLLFEIHFPVLSVLDFELSIDVFRCNLI